MKNALRAVTLLTLAVITAVFITACGGSGTSATATGTNVGGPTALQVIDTQVGTGAVAAAGDTLTVYYTGWLYDAAAPNFEGTEFGSTTTSQPFSFELGVGQVIAGWDQGLVGMSVGGTRTLIIPSALAYGAAGSGAIPPNAPLVFSVQLLSVQ